MKHSLSQSLKREFHRSRTLVFVVFVFCMAAVLSFLSTGNMTNSSAANAADFKPGNIISDAVMANYNTMSVAEIQAFLDSKNKCSNTDYNYYLQLTKSQPTIKWHWSGEPYNGHFVCMAEEKFGDGEIIGTGMTAAEIIYDAAQVNKINPQVLLVLLQKESSLITDKVPNDFDYRKATGYGCPDTAACDSKYYGFKNQIYRAAELFRYTLDNGSTTYREDHNAYVGYHPNSSCGGTTVFIENRATASLYRYTPYQPNAAALNAGYGQGNSCSAYGNRNFYLYFTDWFGSTQAAVSGELVTIPDGEYSLVSTLDSSLSLGLKSTNAELTKLDIDNETQRWNIKRDTSTGYYQITNVETGLPLIVNTTTASAGTKVINGKSTTCSKNWRIYRTSDNYLTLETTCSSGMVLNSVGGTAGSSIEVQISSKAKSEKWTLRVGPTLKDGIYNLRTMLDADKDLEIYGDYEYNGANVSIWSHIDRENRKWRITYDSTTDSYTFINLISGKALDLSSGVAKNGTNVAIYDQNTSCAQRWKLVPQSNGSYNILTTCAPGYGLDVYNADKSNGANVSIWSTNYHASQQWQITEVAQAIPDGIYNIRTRLNLNKDLEVYGDYKYNGANVSIWSHIDRENRKWQFTYNQATDDYTIINQGSGKALDLNEARPENGQNIQIWQTNTSCSQRWSISVTNNNYYTIRSACDRHQVLDVYEGRSADGTNVTSFKDHNDINQQWHFVTAE